LALIYLYEYNFSLERYRLRALPASPRSALRDLGICRMKCLNCLDMTGPGGWGQDVLPRDAVFIGGKTLRGDRLPVRPRQHCLLLPQGGREGYGVYIRLGSRILCIPVGIDPNPIPRFSPGN
jgi:hypothetical protein